MFLSSNIMLQDVQSSIIFRQEKQVAILTIIIIVIVIVLQIMMLELAEYNKKLPMKACFPRI